MTRAAAPAGTRAGTSAGTRAGASAGTRAVAGVGLLGAGVAGRAALAGLVGEPLAGLGFAVLLLGAFAIGGGAISPARRSSLVAGLAVGAALLVPGLWLKAIGMPSRWAGLGAGTLLVYSAALVVIAPAEELFLRGLLQPALRDWRGPGAAIVLTAVAFAAIHLPAYGLVALPLDLGVGLLLGWLRQRTGSVAACAIAHLVADLGAWWLP